MGFREEFFLTSALRVGLERDRGGLEEDGFALQERLEGDEYVLKEPVFADEPELYPDVPD